MPEAAQEQPSLEQLVRHLGGQIGQLAQAQAAQQQTLAQLAHGSQATAQAVSRATQPQPDPDGYQRLNAKYLETLATDPVGLRNAEKQQIQAEVINTLRQEMAQNISMAERQRHAEEMEKAIYAQHPALMQDGAQLEYYLKYLANHPGAQSWTLDQKVGRAIEWTYQFAADREAEAIAKHEKRQRSQARGGGPGGGSFRDPGRSDQEADVSPEEANRQRYEMLQQKRFAAMGGGNYAKR